MKKINSYFALFGLMLAGSAMAKPKETLREIEKEIHGYHKARSVKQSWTERDFCKQYNHAQSSYANDLVRHLSQRPNEAGRMAETCWEIFTRDHQKQLVDIMVRDEVVACEFFKKRHKELSALERNTILTAVSKSAALMAELSKFFPKLSQQERAIFVNATSKTSVIAGVVLKELYYNMTEEEMLPLVIKTADSPKYGMLAIRDFYRNNKKFHISWPHMRILKQKMTHQEWQPNFCETMVFCDEVYPRLMTDNKIYQSLIRGVPKVDRSLWGENPFALPPHLHKLCKKWRAKEIENDEGLYCGMYDL